MVGLGEMSGLGINAITKKKKKKQKTMQTPKMGRNTVM